MITRTHLSTSAAIVFAVAFLFSIAAATVHANPLRFPPAVGSATATTSPNYLTSGAATTTLATYDTYSNNGVSGGGSTQAMDNVAILVQTTASSTSSIYWTTYEYSMDGIDWYADNTFARTAAGNVSATVPNTVSFTASSTSREGRILLAATPARFIRVKAQVLGANGAIWAAIQPQKQSN